MKEQTLVVIKPGAVKHRLAGTILSALEQVPKGMRIVDVKLFELTALQAAAFYEEHRGHEYFNDLVERTSSGPGLAVVIEGDGAVDAVRQWIGPTDPRMGDPNVHLRAKYGFALSDNALHASDSAAAFAREIGFVYVKPAQNSIGGRDALNSMPDVEIEIEIDDSEPGQSR